MLRFYLDEDSLDRALIRALRSRGLDILTTFEASRLGTPDDDQLAYAYAAGRVIFTANVKDFNRLHTEWVSTGRHHAGIIAVPDQSTPIGVQLRALVKLATALEPADMADRLEFLSNWID